MVHKGTVYPFQRVHEGTREGTQRYTKGTLGYTGKTKGQYIVVLSSRQRVRTVSTTPHDEGRLVHDITLRV